MYSGNTFKDYVDGLLCATRSRTHKGKEARDDMLARRGTEDEHSRLIDIAQLTMERLSQDEQLTRISDPMLLHWDLHKRNIYVSAGDPTHVTSIIDWQFTSIEPIFMYANDTPDFAEISNALAAKDEEALATPCISSTQDEHSRRDSLISRKTFEVIIAATLPRLAAARAMDDTMLRLFRYCRSSHTSSDLVLRHELLSFHAYGQSLICQVCALTNCQKSSHRSMHVNGTILRRCKSSNSSSWTNWIPARRGRFLQRAGSQPEMPTKSSSSNGWRLSGTRRILI